MDVFMQLFQRNISQWINKLQTPYLCQNNAHYLVFHISQNIAIVKTFNVSKHKKSRIHFPTLKTWAYFYTSALADVYSTHIYYLNNLLFYIVAVC